MMWHQEELAQPPTEAWGKLDLLHYDITPLRNEDLFGEGNSVHDFSRIIKRLVPQAATKQHTVEDWKRVFHNAFNKETQLFKSSNGDKIRRMAVRLATSNPMNLFETGVWEDQYLRARDDTKMWRAAYEIFGAPWNEVHSKNKKRNATEEPDPATPIGNRAMIAAQTVALPMNNKTTDKATTQATTAAEATTTENNNAETETSTNKETGKEKRSAKQSEGSSSEEEDRNEIQPPKKLFLSKPLYKNPKKRRYKLHQMRRGNIQHIVY